MDSESSLPPKVRNLHSVPSPLPQVLECMILCSTVYYIVLHITKFGWIGLAQAELGLARLN